MDWYAADGRLGAPPVLNRRSLGLLGNDLKSWLVALKLGWYRMRMLSKKEMGSVRGGAQAVDCEALQAGIFVAMGLLQFEIAIALAVVYNIYCT